MTRLLLDWAREVVESSGGGGRDDVQQLHINTGTIVLTWSHCMRIKQSRGPLTI